MPTAFPVSRPITTLDEVVLSGGAGGVFADLKQGRLADVDEGGAVKMVGTNLGTAA
jgi:hypothetical protein